VPHVISALLGQTSRSSASWPSTPESGPERRVLAGQLGQAVVFGMERGTGYSAAVARALQHRAANAPVPGPAGGPAAERWSGYGCCTTTSSLPLMHWSSCSVAQRRSSRCRARPQDHGLGDREVILEAG